ncbi:MAG: acyltransferase family protein [Lachnospiraceae bacterium]
MDKERNFGLDLLKILLSFSVVGAHFNYIYSLTNFHVPTFMLFAFFFTEKIVTSSQTRLLFLRIKRLLIPHIFWAIIFYLMRKFVITTREISLKDLGYQLLLGHSPNLNPVMWFQVNLMLFTCIVFLIFFFCKKKTGFLLLFILAILALLAQYMNINYTLFSNLIPELQYPLGRMCEMLPYIFLGISLSHYKIFEMVSKYKRSIFVLSFLFFFVTFNFINIKPQGFDYQGIFKILCCLFLMFFFYFLPFEYLPKRVLDILSFISKYTMGIYILHLNIGYFVMKVFGKIGFTMPSFFNTLCIFLLSLFVSFVISKIPVKIAKQLVT